MTETTARADVVIYHNPRCSKSRETLALIRAHGIEPTVVEYLKTPPSGRELTALAQRMGQPVRALLRESEAAFSELGLDRPSATDADILAAIGSHPILLNRPIVATPLGVRLCRPPEIVAAILPPNDPRA